MATTVSSILTQIKSIASAELGPDWHELPSVSVLSANDVRRGAQGYGVRPLSASEAAGLTGSYSLDHGFELVLMDKNPRKDDESQAQATQCDLYDKLDEIFKEMVRLKINLGGTVLIVNQPALSEPEFVNGREFVAIRMQFNVRYRQTI